MNLLSPQKLISFPFPKSSNTSKKEFNSCSYFTNNEITDSELVDPFYSPYLMLTNLRLNHPINIHQYVQASCNLKKAY